MRANEWEIDEEEIDGWDTYTDEELAFLKYSVIAGSIMVFIGVIARMF